MVKQLVKNIIMVLAVIVIANLGYAAASNLLASGMSIGTSDTSDTLVLNGSGEQLPTDMSSYGYVGDDGLMENAVTVRVKNGYAYTGSWVNESFSVIDVRDPTNPILVGHLEDVTYLAQPIGLDIVGDYAYVASASVYLTIIDISNPSNPFIVGTVNGLANVRDLEVAGAYAYTVEENAYFRVFDVSDPTKPLEVANVYNVSTLTGMWGLEIKGNFAYATSTSDDRLTIIDISDPTNPFVRGSIQDNALNDSRDLVVKGNYVYALSFANENVTVVNVTNPDEPAIVTSIYDTLALNVPQNIELAGDTLYVWAGGYLTAIDISDPISPVIGSSVLIGGDNRPDSFEIDGNKGYLISIQNNRLVIVDLQGWETHTANIGSLETTSLDVLNELDVAEDLVVQGGASVGKQGISSQGGLSVGGRAIGVSPRMYLTDTAIDGDHECDNTPEGTNCCAPGYHMCDPSEFALGGLEVEMHGEGRETTPYNTAGWVDIKAGTDGLDCLGWSDNSATAGSTCSYTTTLACTTTACSTAVRVWCCSD
jgi:hypothetical protein